MRLNSWKWTLWRCLFQKIPNIYFYYCLLLFILYVCVVSKTKENGRAASCLGSQGDHGDGDCIDLLPLRLFKEPHCWRTKRLGLGFQPATLVSFDHVLLRRQSRFVSALKPLFVFFNSRFLFLCHGWSMLLIFLLEFIYLLCFHCSMMRDPRINSFKLLNHFKLLWGKENHTEMQKLDHIIGLQTYCIWFAEQKNKKTKKKDPTVEYLFGNLRGLVWFLRKYRKRENGQRVRLFGSNNLPKFPPTFKSQEK